MAILMGIGPIEAKCGPIGWKGLIKMQRLVSLQVG